jgi:hypothetical protein
VRLQKALESCFISTNDECADFNKETPVRVNFLMRKKLLNIR